MLYGWKENSMLTNCLAACAYLTITVSDIERDMKKWSFYHTALHSTPPGFLLEYRHPLWYEKIAIFTTFCFSGDVPVAITLNVVWMEREFDAYKIALLHVPI